MYEREAESYLLQQGLTLLAKNYHCRFGEIDLIMLDKECLCFIEVKFRHSNAFGGTAYAITPSKQRKIITTALHFLSRNRRYEQSPFRFDAVFIQPSTQHCSTQIEWIASAFEADME